MVIFIAQDAGLCNMILRLRTCFDNKAFFGFYKDVKSLTSHMAHLFKGGFYDGWNHRRGLSRNECCRDEGGG
jgi:hypothetical protein